MKFNKKVIICMIMILSMLHLSAGVAWYPDDTTDRKEFTQYADFAMYQIKRTVKDKFGDFDKEAYRTSQEQYNKEKD